MFRRSRGHHPAVYGQNAAGRPARLVRGEIDRGLRDLLRLPEPTHRMEFFEVGLRLWVLQHTCDTWSHDSGWADAVAPDVPLGIVHRNSLGKHNDARLGRLVGMTFENPDSFESSHCRDVEDRTASLPQHLGNGRANVPERALQ